MKNEEPNKLLSKWIEKAVKKIPGLAFYKNNNARVLLGSTIESSYTFQKLMYNGRIHYLEIIFSTRELMIQKSNQEREMLVDVWIQSLNRELDDSILAEYEKEIPK